MSDYGNPPPQDSYGQQPPSGPAGAYGQQPAYGSGPGRTDAKGFFGALFDFGFNHFVTPKIVKFVYVLAVGALALGWLVFLVVGFANSVGAGLFALIVGPVIVVLYLCFIRMTLEFYLSVTRLSEEIHHKLKS